MVAKRGSILRDFLKDEAAGGIVLIIAALLAMIAANSPLAADYFHLLHIETGPVLAPKLGAMTVHLWVNDALMGGSSSSSGSRSSASWSMANYRVPPIAPCR